MEDSTVFVPLFNKSKFSGGEKRGNGPDEICVHELAKDVVVFGKAM